ncbi:MAG: NAD(P)H-hydrate dehydratase [Desulfobacterales bacterium]|nr:NAD(P)H-hydrate dehydratase [Desulfobacterales bacterium]
MYLVTAGEMQEMDRRTIETFGLPGRLLMENAGRGATRVLLQTFSGLTDKKVAVIAGRGNNGGDGFVMARCLFQKGVPVRVFLLAEGKTVKGDAAANLKLLKPLGIPVDEIPDRNAFKKYKTAMRHQDIWVDAILGTGLKSDVDGYFREIIDFINARNRPVFSVDIPSGLDSDSGHPRGACIRAHTTATFGFAKIGHVLLPGADYTGRLQIVDIGIPDHIAAEVGPTQYLLTAEMIQDRLAPRSSDAHKGTTGHLLVVAGSPGKTGAAAMTAAAAMRTGAGLVTLGVPASLNPVLETQVLEAMTVALPETVDAMFAEAAFDRIQGLLSGKQSLVFGPGVGISSEIESLLRRMLPILNIPMVIDADGLNNLAADMDMLKTANAPIILTPHPGEMARLLGASVQQVQTERLTCARELARKYKLHVVLKGARTVIAHPDGKAYINPTGNAGMASGGMGDVLTGVIGGLLAQGYTPEAAAHVGVYLHGAAADRLAEQIGPIGFLASDVINAIPAQIKKLLNG